MNGSTFVIIALVVCMIGVYVADHFRRRYERQQDCRHIWELPEFNIRRCVECGKKERIGP